MIAVDDYFSGVATKRLTAVDIDSNSSNQHEFNGRRELVELFGEARGKKKFTADFIYLNDEIGEDEYSPLRSTITWYDAREAHPTRSEYRLYYPASTLSVMGRAEPGDLIFIAQRRDFDVEKNAEFLLVVAKDGSTVLNQLLWVFDIKNDGKFLQPEFDLSTKPQREQMATDALLRLLGVIADTSNVSYLEGLLESFGDETWPSGAEFSAYARRMDLSVDPISSPDVAIVEWVSMEHTLFQTLERHRIHDAVSAGFLLPNGETDINGFLELSLSVLNRRKSRAGGALERHLGVIFEAHGLQHATQATTEGKKKPDFLFPSATAYKDLSYPENRLTVLGSKTSLKDRWRQVLTEANRVTHKHLFTLQPAISLNQTNEMRAHNLQLVIPQSLHEAGFAPDQASWLMNLQEFIQLVKDRHQIA